MPENPVSRRNVLKYTAAAGVGATAVGRFAGTASAAEPAPGAARAPGPLDTLVFGDATSEKAHGLTAALSDVVATGGLGQSARVLRPTDPVGFWGGRLAFTMACAPTGTTYVTVKLWGDENDGTSQETASGTRMWRLQLFCDGLQVGHTDEGAVDCLDILDTAPRAPGRFFFHTLPLPEKLTKGKTKVALEIRAEGRIWSYGNTSASFFYDMTTASRGVYRLYTHTDPYFTPPAGDVQGPAPTPRARTSPGAEVLTAIRERVLKDTAHLLNEATPAALDGWAMQQLAEAYLWPDGPAYQDDRALDRTLQAIDGRYHAWKSDAGVLTGSDQQWQGFGRVGLVLALLWEHLGDRLKERVTGSPYAIANPGFEEGSGTTATGWAVMGWVANGTATRDSTVHRSGSYSMKLVRGSSGANAIAVGNVTKVSLDRGTYEYGVWVKTQDVTGKGVYLDVLFYDAGGKIVGTDNKAYSATGTNDWAYVSLKLDTPPTATQAWLFIGVPDGGTAWIDDVTLVAPSTGTHVPPVRRDAYVEMLAASREYWRRHFPHYSNQSQICAIGLYQCNRGLRLLDESKAWPEERARDYLYQSIGLKPWLGPEDADGTPTRPLGSGYLQVTRKGLTRELGYVGNYGEVTDWLIMMYESVTRGYRAQEAPELRDQMVKMVRTRGLFHPFDVDADGCRVARLETVIGWRNEVYPGQPGYAQRTAWDSHPLQAAVAFEDPRLIGWTQEMMADGQLWPQLHLLQTHPWTRVGLNAFRLIARDWDAFQKLPRHGDRMPTGWERPDFVFTDEENGAVAVKNGTEILYASLYFRARQAVNDYARIHLLTPADQRSATIRERSAGLTGDTFTVRDWITWDYAINDPAAGGIPPGGFPPPGETPHQALAGDVLHRAPIPADVPDPALGVHFDGVEEMLVGRAPLYVCEYGPYVLVMNTTTDKVYTVPSLGEGQARDLRTGKRVNLRQPHRVGPLMTLVLRREAEDR
ncbi:hypothetical protein GCM10023196_051640 [Actinoallomurus vinaceus]|uniref:Tat pathway signal sequence domain protein n=1 Tax=Actinoallomurus vinaceus TaxID=1080074 RepID=A0ABP8UF58_9ACTN